ncbi:MAG: hypothetical protein NTW19_02100 [Planctomycetota bacterium]|nr:hypothetical protein [Planctomycetota bacterium]
MRDRRKLTPALVSRAEEHLTKFVLVDDGRKPCSAANDYQFHGYNDNMPAMAVRAMVFAGDALGRADLRDLGLYYLEGLCAHFERRGMLAEYNSGTYTPICLAALLDVAEVSTTREAAEIARVCADRILLDVVGHWHMGIGHPVGSMSRCYLPDYNRTTSNMNALAWYIGLPHTVDLIPVLTEVPPGLVVHHGPDQGFALAQFCETMVANFSKVRPEIKAWARQERKYPYAVRGTSDAGRTSAVQDRAWVAPLWSLGTANKEMWIRQAGHHNCFNASLARRTPLRSFKDRVSFWHLLTSGEHDLGETIPAGYNGYTTESSHTNDCGQYHTIQNKGSALVLANFGTGMNDKDIAPAKFFVAASTFGQPADEIFENDTPLAAWDGPTDSRSWQFMRFGAVYVAIRMAGVLDEKQLPVRRSTKNGYPRVEVVLAEGAPLVLTAAKREWLDLGFVFEIADEAECGSFAAFRKQVLATTWEAFHCFYRNSRYTGRHGDLQIVDTIEPHDIRFMAVDNRVEQPTFLQAPGLDPRWLELWPDARRSRQRRIMYRPDFVGSPFYTHKQNILAADAKRE